MPETTRPVPAAAALTFDGRGTSVGDSWDVHTFRADAGTTLVVRLGWDEPNADLNHFLREPGASTAIAWDNDLGPGPVTIRHELTRSGEWSVAVKHRTGSSSLYRITVGVG